MALSFVGTTVSFIPLFLNRLPENLSLAYSKAGLTFVFCFLVFFGFAIYTFWTTIESRLHLPGHYFLLSFTGGAIPLIGALTFDRINALTN